MYFLYNYYAYWGVVLAQIYKVWCVGKTGMAGDAKRYKEIHVHISYNMTI